MYNISLAIALRGLRDSLYLTNVMFTRDDDDDWISRREVASTCGRLTSSAIADTES